MAEINVNNTSYNVTEDWLRIAAKYFDIDQNSTSSVNMLKAGLFGYNNEIQSNEIKNNVYHRNILYDEHFVNTASFPESINNFAKLYDVPIETATPAHLRAVLSINKLDIINNPYVVVEEVETELGQRYSNQKLIMNNEYSFLIDNINFVLPYPIRFDIRKVNGGYNVIASYVVDADNSFPYITLESPYIKTWTQTMMDEEEYILVNIDLFQLEANSMTMTVTDNNLLDSMYIEKDFLNQLAYVEVFYTENGVKEKIEVEQNERILTKNGKKVCYLTIVDNDTFRISFSSNSRGFKPTAGSEITINYYTTKGTGGNFSYSGYIAVNFNNQGEFDKIPVTITPISDSTGGSDKLTIDEIKNKVIEAALTRNNYITDKDLEYYFNNFNTDTSINGSRVSFFKKRNDLLKRTFSGYLLLRDGDKKVLPTNTAKSLYIPSIYSKTTKYVNGNAYEYYTDMINESARVLLDCNTEYEPKFYLTNNDDAIATDGEKFKVADVINDVVLYYQLRKINGEMKPVVIRELYAQIKNNKDPNSNNVGLVQTIYYYDDNTRTIMCRTPKFFIDGMTGETLPFDSLDDIIQPTNIAEANPNEIFYAVGKDLQVVEYLGEVAVANLDVRTEMDGPMSTNGLLVYWDPRTNGNDSFTINRDEMQYGRFIEYSIPYTIKLLRDTEPSKSRYYDMIVNSSYKFKTEYVNEAVTDSFITNTLEVTKYPKEFTYTFTVLMNSSIEEARIDDSIEIRGIIYDVNSGMPIGFIPFTRFNDSSTYEAKLTTNMDEVNSEDKILITSGIYPLQSTPENMFATNEVWLDSDIDVSVAVFYKDEGLEAYKHGDYAEISGGYMDNRVFKDATSAIIYRTTTRVSMFKKLEQYMESNLLKVNSRDFDELEHKACIEAEVPVMEGEVDYLILKNVPLIEYNYYNEYYNDINSLLEIYHDMTKAILDKLENNNSLDIKFYNTYGVSNNWAKDVTRTETNKQVDNVAITLNFTMYVNKSVTDSEDLMIKQFISNFVESSNKNGIFAMSNLLRALENNFTFIVYVEFGLIDGSDIQKVYSVEKNAWEYITQDVVDYVPEFLNVKKKIMSTNQEDFAGDGEFYFNIYEYDIEITYV